MLKYVARLQYHYEQWEDDLQYVADCDHVIIIKNQNSLKISTHSQYNSQIVYIRFTWANIKTD